MSRHLTFFAAAILIHAFIARLSADDLPAPNSQKITGQKLLTPEQAVAAMKLPPGFRVSVFAAEPHVRQPIALTTDHRGRLWVAENYTYAERGKNFDVSLRDRVVILEDTDGDGRFDRRKVFWDQGKKLTSVEVGFGGVWVLCAPKMLFIPDRDGDDAPDGEPQVVLDGFDDGPVRHNIVNGLKWGPDGWLYGRHGIQATSLVGKPGAADSQRVRINCSIWRYHPQRKTFEAVCHGTTNSWGFDYDDHGQMFFINTVIGHLWHVVPGARYQRMYGADFNAHAYELIQQTADHVHWDKGERWSDSRKGISDTTSRAGGGHAHCGLMIYLGDNWPDRYRNGLFTVNLHGRRLNNDVLERQGCGYVGKHGEDFLTSSDEWFRGIEMVYGHDGGVYLADWSDVGECHENDGVHRTSGRIFKITYGKPRNSKTQDLSKLIDHDLIELQRHKNDWFVRQARRILQERAAEGKDMAAATKELNALFHAKSVADVRVKLRAMWCLYSIGATSESWLLRATKHDNEHVRAWAVRLLADGESVSVTTAKRLADLAHGDPSGLVRLFVASAMHKSPLPLRWKIAAGLGSHENDAGDRMLPLITWYGIEPVVASSPDKALKLAWQSRIPLLRRHVARRLTEEIEDQPSGVDGLMDLVATARDDRFRVDILAGMNAALEGWRKAPRPKSWPKVANRLTESSNGEVARLSRELGVVFGDGRAIDQLRKTVTGGADPLTRRSALRTLVESRADGLLPLLRKLVDDRVMAGEAIRGLASFDESNTPALLLSRYPRLRPAEREEAVNTLCARPDFAARLLEAVARGAIDRRDVSAYHARQIRAFNRPELNRSLVKVWGNARESSAEKKRRIAELKRLLTLTRLKKADVSNGRLMFNKSCANCHALYGKGGAIGPDLTGSNRHNLDYLLENIVDPSATMVNDYKMSVIHLKDGRATTGVVVEKKPRTLIVQTQKERVVINRADVDKMEAKDVSLMPDGLLKPLNGQQVRDLIAYLSSRRQAPLKSPPP